MLWTILGAIAFVLFLIAIYEIITSSMDVTKKVIWGVIVLLLPYLGVILWFLIGRKGK